MKQSTSKSDQAAGVTLGWREWLSLPELGIDAIKAKVDTGARTSALHAFAVEPFEADGRQRVRFLMHPLQRDEQTVVECLADVVDRRQVTDSGGHRSLRWVIRSEICIGSHRMSAEMTLTSRDDMLFRMLLGRSALRGWARVDPGRSYLVGKRRAPKD